MFRANPACSGIIGEVTGCLSRFAAAAAGLISWFIMSFYSEEVTKQGTGRLQSLDAPA
jgi:hypothetical protein